MQTHRFFSLRQRFRYVAGSILLILGLCALLISTAVYRHIETIQTDAAEQLAKINATLIANELEVYRGIVKNLAHIDGIQDLALFGDKEEAQEWAVNQRKLLPDSIGLAIVDNDFQVRGDPHTLRLGNQCISDLKFLFGDKRLSYWPVHQGAANLEHFDLMHPIKDSKGQTIAILFASFRLDIIQRRIELITESGIKIIVRDGNGELIAKHSTLDLDRPAIRKLHTLPNSDWQVEVTVNQKPIIAMVLTTVTLIVGAFSIVFAIFSIATADIIRLVGLEIQKVREALERIRHGENEHTPIEPALEETASVLGEISAITYDICSQKEQLSRLCLVDELTGLPNRRFLNANIADVFMSTKNNCVVYVVLIDMDNFKQLNDTQGHDAGDMALVMLSKIFQEFLRQDDMVARLGGDEFAVLLVRDNEEAVSDWYRDVSTALSERLEEHAWLDGGQYSLSLSAGAVRMDPSLDEYPGATLRRADVALYEAKRTGKGRLILASDARTAPSLSTNVSVGSC